MTAPERRRGRAGRRGVWLRLDATLACVAGGGAMAERLLGLPIARLLGKPFPGELPFAEADTIEEVLAGVVSGSAGAVVVAELRGAGAPRWLELAVLPTQVEAEPGTAARSPRTEERDALCLELRIEDVTARVGEEMRLRAALAEERFLGEFAVELARWPDSGLDDALTVGLERLARRFGAQSARIVAPSGADPDSHSGSASESASESDAGSDATGDAAPASRVRRASIVGIASAKVLELVFGDEGHGGSFSARLLDRYAEILGALLARAERGERPGERLALARQIELETRVAELSRFFVDLDVDATDAGVASQLAVVADLAEAQHSWFYSFTTGRSGPEFFDWWREPRADRMPVPLEYSVTTFPYSTNLIRGGHIYRVPSVDALPAAAASERRDLEARGVRSLLGIPIMSGGRFVGFLGFESYEREVQWSEETSLLLRLVGEIFYSGLRRRRTVVDLRHSESQLLQAQKMEAVGTLAGGIAHDFNNHLAVMLGNARFLRQEVKADGDVIAAIEDLERSADHCAKLTRSLLAFSRRSAVEVVPVDVAELVRGVEGLVKPLLPGGFELETVLGSALGEVAVDPVQIQQVLVNLLVNARDAMPGGGRIRMSGERRTLTEAEAALEGLDLGRTFVVLGVADTGTGMDAETLRRVFEPFFTTKPVGQGTGLGLAMAYGIVRQSGGAIAIESRVGEGATVRVYLPALVEAREDG